jgi:altronate dehydratase large subunit
MSTTANEKMSPSKGTPRPLQFEGYQRSRGRVGVRNHVAVISTVALCNRIAQLAAARSGSPLVIEGDFQRGLQTEDAALQETILTQLLDHPNIGAALVLCHDRRTAQRWQQQAAAHDKPIETLAVMDCQGVQNAIDSASAAIARLTAAASEARRVPCSLSQLTFALECGGSDASSAVCSNPAIGQFVDWAIGQGATVIVSETAEFIGAEDVVKAQSVSAEVADAINACIQVTEQRMAGDGDHYRGVNPTPENIEAGLSTLIEKTMGAVCKIGNARFQGCLRFGEVPSQPGLYFMDTPFFSPCSITGMVSAGAQITLFSMGVFNPSGNPLSPTLKVCGNPDTVRHWADGIDVDISALIQGHISLSQAADQIAQTVSRTASGEISKTEAWGEGQFIIPRALPAF